MAKKISPERTEKSIQKSIQKTLELIKQNSHITIADLAQQTGLSDPGIKKHLRKLQQESLLKRIGPDKGGHWEVLKEKLMAVKDVISRRGDLSTFLVHLTRNYDGNPAKDNLREIISKARIYAKRALKVGNFRFFYLHQFRLSRLRYWIASARCSVRSISSPARSAMVLEILRILS